MQKNWITGGSKTPFYTRKILRITKPVQQAVARVCGLGQFVFHVNGEKISDHELDPGWTNYHKRIQYVTFDVTSHFTEGENVLGAEVGNGWFIMAEENYSFHFPPFMPPNPNPYQPFGESLVLALELVIIYADGSTETVTADETFKVRAHEITMSNIYGSETVDGSQYSAGWDQPGYDDSDWENAVAVAEDAAPEGELEEQSQPEIRVIHRYEASTCIRQVAAESMIWARIFPVC